MFCNITIFLIYPPEDIVWLLKIQASVLTVLSVNGQGNASKSAGGTNGNLLLVMNVANSKIFKRDDLNLYVEAPVSLSTAVNGGDIERY